MSKFDLRFGLPIDPVAKGRPKVSAAGKFVRVYTPKKTAVAERQIIALSAKYAPTAPLQRPLEVELAFTFTPPVSKSAWFKDAAERGYLLPSVKPDVDNLAKLVLDALTCSGKFWRDDAQIVKLTCSKGYGDQPQVWVRIQEADCVVNRAEWLAVKNLREAA